jgi:hypothetical protein
MLAPRRRGADCLQPARCPWDQWDERLPRPHPVCVANRTGPHGADRRATTRRALGRLGPQALHGRFGDHRIGVARPVGRGTLGIVTGVRPGSLSVLKAAVPRLGAHKATRVRLDPHQASRVGRQVPQYSADVVFASFLGHTVLVLDRALTTRQRPSRAPWRPHICQPHPVRARGIPLAPPCAGTTPSTWCTARPPLSKPFADPAM